MNFVEFKEQIRKNYPAFKDLLLLTRIRIRLDQNLSTHTETITEGMTTMSQTYKVYTYKGVTYFYKFGW